MATRTTNPVLLILLASVIVLVVVARRSSAPWAASFSMYAWVAGFVIVVRVFFRVLFGASGPTVLIRLPRLDLPGFLSSVHLFGPVSAEAVILTVSQAMQLAVMILAVGAANTLADPKRLLASVPSALYEWGTVIVVSLTVFPQLAESVGRVYRARQLRAEAGKGIHLIRNIAMPVLSDALDRSLVLAGAMDSRGYGRSSGGSPRVRRVASAMLLVSTLAMCVGAYALMDPLGLPAWLGAPMMVVAIVMGIVGLWMAGKRVVRTRYRVDHIGVDGWITIASGVVSAAVVCIAVWLDPSMAHPGFAALAWPEVSIAALLGILVAGIPALKGQP